MKKLLLSGVTSLLFLFAFGQKDSSIQKHKIAFFAPLYLDSAFTTDGEYRYGKMVFPKFINPGLEFYEGAQLALDSLAKENEPLEVFIYDTRSASETIQDQLNKAELDNVELIITYCSNAEVKLFADAGLKKNIPVINANLPNDGNVTSNPFYVMLNPTLKTQCEGIYKHLQKYYSLDPIVIFRKKGSLEDRIKSYFDDYGKSTLSIPLKLKFVELSDTFSINQLQPYLDTTQQTICLAGSLDENFGKRLSKQLAMLKKKEFQPIVIGMPTWDNITEFNKPEYKGIEIIYGTPFYNPRNDAISRQIIYHFKKIMFARPSDMVMRGYEVMWKFSKLLLMYKTDFASNIANKEFNVFREYDIQPILNKHSTTLDYFENKKIYFLKWQDGGIKGVY